MDESTKDNPENIIMATKMDGNTDKFTVNMVADCISLNSSIGKWIGLIFEAKIFTSTI